MNNLTEFSKSYRQEANNYKLFSDAEDKPDLIWKNIHELFHNKSVLDVGCGNGKYLEKLSQITDSYYGIDLAYQQLMQCPYLVAQANACQLPFKDEQFDCVLSCWVVGTILENSRQLQALQEMKRVCKTGGKIILVENDLGGEFEDLRGRNPLIDNRTKIYNDFLLNQGFHLRHQINTYFEFSSSQTAQHVFYSIWKERLTKIISLPQIKHSVAIFELNK